MVLHFQGEGNAKRGGSMKARAAVLRESPGRYEVVDVDIDSPRDHEVLIRYVASGLCHSDLHFLDGSHAACGGTLSRFGCRPIRGYWI